MEEYNQSCSIWLCERPPLLDCLAQEPSRWNVAWLDGLLHCWGDHLWSFRKGRLSCSTQGYTPLVEVNQAVIAWSFRQLLLVNLEHPALWSKLSTMIITLDNGAWQKTHVGWPTLPLNLLSYFISRLSEVLKKASSEWSNADDYLRNQMELAELTVSV